MIYQVNYDHLLRFFETKETAINFCLHHIINRVNDLLIDIEKNYNTSTYNDYLIDCINKFIIHYNKNEFEEAIKCAENSAIFHIRLREIEINYDSMPLVNINLDSLHKINKIIIFK